MNDSTKRKQRKRTVNNLEIESCATCFHCQMVVAQQLIGQKIRFCHQGPPQFQLQPGPDGQMRPAFGPPQVSPDYRCSLYLAIDFNPKNDATLTGN